MPPRRAARRLRHDAHHRGRAGGAGAGRTRLNTTVLLLPWATQASCARRC